MYTMIVRKMKRFNLLLQSIVQVSELDCIRNIQVVSKIANDSVVTEKSRVIFHMADGHEWFVK